jgi:hypothetical protein
MSHEKIDGAKALRELLRARLVHDDEFYLYELMPEGESKMGVERSLWSNLEFRRWYALGLVVRGYE